MSNPALIVAPMQWADLEDIDNVEPICSADLACLAEIREVLKKFGKRERFGVALLHKHFDLADDEVLVEHTIKEDRVLTIRPTKLGAAGKTVETIWMLLDGEPGAMLGCRQYCSTDEQGDHDTFHRTR